MRARVKRLAVAAGLRALSLSGAHRLAGHAFRGLGAILMFHRVRPEPARLKVNRNLSVTPGFLSKTIEIVQGLGYAIVSMDEALDAIRAGGAERPFVTLTFDDGYRDNFLYAEPALRAAGVPFCIYVAPGLTDAAVPAWWEDLEAGIVALPRVSGRLAGESFDMTTRTLGEKNRAAQWLALRMRLAPDAEARALAGRLRSEAGEAGAVREPLFMSWDELRSFAASPLCTIGAHTITHPRLAGLGEEEVRRELGQSRARIEAELGRPVRHLAYPYGGKEAAGVREFRIAAEIGFDTAVTTRPGVLHPQHAEHLTALPRIPVNGEWQDPRALTALLSGLPMAVWSRGRRLDVA